MQITYYSTGDFVAHKYRLPGRASKFSVWFNIDGFPVDAERIDSRGRCYPVNQDSAAWREIAKRKLAGHENATEIAKRAKS